MNFLNKKVKNLTRKELWQLIKGKQKAETNLLTPFNQFVLDVTIKNPQKYGMDFQKRIEFDCMSSTRPSKGKEKGDLIYINTNGEDTPIEIKASVKNNFGMYRIDRLRPFHNVPYHIFILIDDDGNVFCFCLRTESLSLLDPVPLNGSKEDNENNTNVETCVTINDEKFEILKKLNILRGTSYDDLLDYWNGYMNVNEINKNHSIKRTKSSTNKESYNKKLSFKVDGHIIQNKTKQETICDLITYLQPDFVYGVMYKFHLDLSPSRYREYKMGKYYFDPRISSVNRHKFINKWNKKYPNRKIEMIEK